MSVASLRAAAASNERRDRPPRRSRRGRRPSHIDARPRSLNAVVSALILAGSGLLIYPSAGTWFTDRVHVADVSGYVQTVKSSSSDVLDKLLDDARRYNAALPTGPLRDPFTLTESGTAESINASRSEYDKQLTLGSDGVIARLRVPSISLDLPIYHGTAPATLDEGVGHLYGSSLPVGGEGTHAVLTGHSGLPNAT
ncbi:sortase, partial [Mesorhizobium japonicum]|uniref:sortase n=1 Tax=Mesorhizobium japonicum TaxID=2066070 RepID=UPI003B5C4FCA